MSGHALVGLLARWAQKSWLNCLQRIRANRESILILMKWGLMTLRRSLRMIHTFRGKRIYKLAFKLRIYSILPIATIPCWRPKPFSWTLPLERILILLTLGRPPRCLIRSSRNSKRIFWWQAWRRRLISWDAKKSLVGSSKWMKGASWTPLRIRLSRAFPARTLWWAFLLTAQSHLLYLQKLRTPTF